RRVLPAAGYQPLHRRAAARRLARLRRARHRHLRPATGRARGHLALARGGGERGDRAGDGGRSRCAASGGSSLGGPTPVASRVNPRRAHARRKDVNAAVAEKTELDLEAFVADEYPAVVAAVGLITGNR